jgi:hypothetical protein
MPSLCVVFASRYTMEEELDASSSVFTKPRETELNEADDCSLLDVSARHQRPHAHFICSCTLPAVRGQFYCGSHRLTYIVSLVSARVGRQLWKTGEFTDALRPRPSARAFGLSGRSVLKVIVAGTTCAFDSHRRSQSSLGKAMEG